MRKASRWVGVACAAALLVTPAAANASFQLYADKNYNGLLKTHHVAGFWNMSAANNDTLSSLKNQTPYTAAIWKGSNRTGHCWDYMSWTNDPSFWWKDDNTASSYALGERC